MFNKKEKKEMPAHAKSRKKREWYSKSKPTDPKMSLDAYVDFLGQNQGIIPPQSPGKPTNTTHNKP